MTTPVDLGDLLEAFGWVSANDSYAEQAGAFVCKDDGRILWWGDGVEEALPDDIEDRTRYVPVPGQHEFDLGRRLALRFVEEQLPQSSREVSGFFEKAGAYARFKTLLERAGRLDAWHRYEQAAQEAALAEWCTENGLQAVRRSP